MTIAPNKVMLEMLREKWVKVKVFDGTIECARWYGGFSGLYGDTGTDLKWKITLTRSVVEREREYFAQFTIAHITVKSDCIVDTSLSVHDTKFPTTCPPHTL